MGEKEVKVATFNFETEALMWAETLRDEGIPCILVPLGAGAAGFGASVWRMFEMRVRESDLERAQRILAPYLGADERQFQDEPENESESEDENG